MFSLQSAVRDLDAKQIEAAPSFGTGLRLDFMRGMARTGAGFMTLLDVTRALSVNDLAAMVLTAGARSMEPGRGTIHLNLE